jgi:hypothetical protein
MLSTTGALCAARDKSLMSGLVLGSVTRPMWIECEEEAPDDPNLEWMNIPELKRQYREKRDDQSSIGSRLLRGAVEAIDRCNHNWGMTHFWGNPLMYPPCQVTRINGQWYRRKSCDHITEENAKYSSE